MKRNKTLLNEFGFDTIDQYYKYIIESYVNGNISQSESLFRQMKRAERQNFLTYLVNVIQYENDVRTLIIIEHDKSLFYSILKNCISLIY